MGTAFNFVWDAAAPPSSGDPPTSPPATTPLTLTANGEMYIDGAVAGGGGNGLLPTNGGEGDDDVTPFDSGEGIAILLSFTSLFPPVASRVNPNPSPRPIPSPTPTGSEGAS